MQATPLTVAQQQGQVSAWALPLLACATVVSAYQIYFLPAADTYFPLALLLMWACVPLVRVRTADLRLLTIFVSYAALVVLSGAWSPDKGAWATGVLYGFLFFFAFFVARSFDAAHDLGRIVFWFLVFASINALLVIVFRLSPAIEDTFLNSSLRGVFKNPKLLANIDLFRPNVFDPDKAGGIFDNANTGAAFSLLCLGATISAFKISGRGMSLYFLVVFSLATLMSGSKSAAMFFVAGMLVLSLMAVTRIGNAYQRVICLCAIGLALAAAIGLAAMFGGGMDVESSDFGQDVSATSEYRFMLWRAARLSFPSHPIRGLGYGGWSIMLSGFAATGVNISWPPHNSLIMAWSESGIVAALLLVTVWVVLVWRLVRAARVAPHVSQPLGALFALVAIAAMSMGDTFPLFGNQNMSVPLGVLVALGMFHQPDEHRAAR